MCKSLLLLSYWICSSTYINVYKQSNSPVICAQYTDVALKLMSEADSLLSICEFGDDISDSVITDNVVIIYCFLF
jgi:hypothetical protein